MIEYDDVTVGFSCITFIVIVSFIPGFDKCFLTLQDVEFCQIFFLYQLRLSCGFSLLFCQCGILINFILSQIPGIIFTSALMYKPFNKLSQISWYFVEDICINVPYRVLIFSFFVVPFLPLVSGQCWPYRMCQNMFLPL